MNKKRIDLSNFDFNEFKVVYSLLFWREIARSV